MAKTISFNNGTQDITLNVRNCFSYTYNALKTVLKLTFAEKDCSFQDIAELKKCVGRIKYYEDDDLKTEYTGYNLGANGFVCNYLNGEFSVELTQESSIGIRLDNVENSLDSIMEILASLA